MNAARTSPDLVVQPRRTQPWRRREPGKPTAPQEHWFPGVHCAVGGGGDFRGLSQPGARMGLGGRAAGGIGTELVCRLEDVRVTSGSIIAALSLRRQQFIAVATSQIRRHGCIVAQGRPAEAGRIRPRYRPQPSADGRPLPMPFLKRSHTGPRLLRGIPPNSTHRRIRRRLQSLGHLISCASDPTNLSSALRQSGSVMPSARKRYSTSIRTCSTIRITSIAGCRYECRSNRPTFQSPLNASAQPVSSGNAHMSRTVARNGSRKDGERDPLHSSNVQRSAMFDVGRNRYLNAFSQQATAKAPGPSQPC